MGVCTGVSSACAIAGYALESKCHLGKSIILDTITVLGWSSSIQNHGIQTVIDKVLNITDVDWGYGTTGGEQSSFGFGWPWGPGSGDVPPPKQPKLPPAIVVEDCVVCSFFFCINFIFTPFKGLLHLGVRGLQMKPTITREHACVSIVGQGRLNVLFNIYEQENNLFRIIQLHPSIDIVREQSWKGRKDRI